MPMERAVPSMIRVAASRSMALRSAILVWAISRTWARVTRAGACSRPVVAEPFSTPAALRSRSAAGGVLRMNVKLRSSKMVICAGMTWPAWAAVLSL